MKLIKAIPLILLLSSCGPLGMLSSLGGGPSATAIGTQIGKENVQQVVAKQDRYEAGRDINASTREVEAQNVETVNVTHQNIPLWAILLLVLGWLLPSPNEIGRYISSLFKRKT